MHLRLPVLIASIIVKQPPDKRELDLLHSLTWRRFSGRIVVMARDELQGVAFKRAGAPTVLYPFRDAMDFTAEHLTALIRTEKDTS